MKRAVLRISVLAVIVALGLIAIAQAQRGLGTASQAADPSAVSAKGGIEPFALPSGVRANPLRNGRSSSFSGNVSATALTTEAGTGGGQGPESTAVQPAVRHVADPFGSTPPTNAPQSIVNTAELSAAGPSPVGTPMGPALSTGQLPMGGAPLASAAAGSDSLPAASTGSGPAGLTLPTEPVRNDMVATAPRGAGTSAVADSRNLPASQGDPREPARLPVEPFAAAGSAPTSAVANNTPLGTTAEPMPIGPAMEQAAPIGTAPSSANIAGQGTGTPGDAQLEGPQAPQLTIQKSGSPEIQVGKPAKFQVKVRNTGASTAQNVEIRDEVPRGAQLVSTTPQASRGVRGELVWSLGALRPGEEAVVEMEVNPVAEGEIGSVATVTFNAAASAKSIATKPELAIQTVAPRQAMIGEEVVLSITVSNPGSGVATDVVLEERVPPGLQHAAGAELEYNIGSLKPHESRQIELRLTATQAGRITNPLIVRGANNLRTEDRVELEVLAPKLEVALEGPKRRYLEREAVYTVTVSNPGTAPAHQVQLVAQLPTGLKFVNANNSGSFDQDTQTVRWLLEELPANETGSVQLTAIPVVAGEQTIRVKGSAGQGLQSEKEHSILVEGIAAILFEAVDVADPIEVNGETTYEIRVVNQGSKAATNVRVLAELPPGMRPIAAEGPTQHVVSGNNVSFEALARLAPKADTTYRIRVQGLQPGDQRVRVQLQTDEMKTPVTKEESTRVYSDG